LLFNTLTQQFANEIDKIKIEGQRDKGQKEEGEEKQKKINYLTRNRFRNGQAIITDSGLMSFAFLFMIQSVECGVN